MTMFATFSVVAKRLIRVVGRIVLRNCCSASVCVIPCDSAVTFIQLDRIAEFVALGMIELTVAFSMAA
jgi:hypothetical protein